MHPALDYNHVRTLIEPFNRPGSPGGIVAISRDGEVEWSLPFGLASLEHAVANKTETMFYIASTSKQFVAASIALLEAEGRLSLDDSIADWLPEVANLGDIKVHDLVHHTSGIRDIYGLAVVGDLAEELIATDRGIMALLSQQRSLNFAPSTRVMYSNSGYFLLAKIVERVTGDSFDDFTTTRIFQPMRMNETRFRSDTDEVVPHRASGYSLAPDGSWKLAEYTWSALGPGGVITTASSLARWAKVYLDNPLQPRELPDRLLRTRSLADGSPNNYAFGVVIGEHNGARLIEHGGGVRGFAAQMVHVPDEALTLICLANAPSVNPQAVVQRLLDRLLPPRLAVASADLGGGDAATETPDVDDLVGRYVDEDEASVVSISHIDGQLSLELMSQRVPLTAVNPGNFRTANGASVVFDAGGLTLSAGSGTTRYIRLRPSENAAVQVVGDFRNQELDVTLTVTTDGERQLIGWRHHDPQPLFPLATDLFQVTTPWSMPMIVRFLREGDAVTGLRVGASRSVGLHFLRWSAT